MASGEIEDGAKQRVGKGKLSDGKNLRGAAELVLYPFFLISPWNINITLVH
jgi:hypothetical protein